MGRAFLFIKKLLYDADAYAAVTYRRKQDHFKVKNSKKAPRFVPFCSMYGNVLSYPVEDAGFATSVELGRGGALCAPRAPHVPSNVEWLTLAARLVGRFLAIAASQESDALQMRMQRSARKATR